MSPSAPAETAEPGFQERRVAILGPGLLGGSIALALTDRLGCSNVSLWGRRPAFIKTLGARAWPGLATTDLAEALKDASLVVFATPVGTMPELARRAIEAGVAADCLFTDVGSVKLPVVTALTGLLEGVGQGFVGSHPMAGSERTGIDAASPGLFLNAPCIVTPVAEVDGRVGRLERFWRALGCQVRTMDAARHDELIARVSHLPHLVAALLVRQAVDGEDPARLAAVAGPGFRDTTRVAAGDAAMWTEILLENRAALVPLLEGLRDQLGTTLEMLRQLDDVALRSLLEQASICRSERFTFPDRHA